MSRFTKLVEASNEALDRQDPDSYTRNQTRSFVTTISCIQKYATKYKLGFNKAQDTSRDCLDNGFIESLRVQGHQDRSRITAKGRKFIGKPLGFLNELLDSYSASVQFFFGGALVAFVVFAVRIVTFIAHII